jgi:hypothetical protein
MVAIITDNVIVIISSSGSLVNAVENISAVYLRMR